MDDSIDQMQKTAKAIVFFEITSFDPADDGRWPTQLWIAPVSLQRAMPLLSNIQHAMSGRSTRFDCAG